MLSELKANYYELPQNEFQIFWNNHFSIFVVVITCRHFTKVMRNLGSKK